jgi:ssDNA-binding Zn-finger/Zn-ribbon topoisomerase 1
VVGSQTLLYTKVFPFNFTYLISLLFESPQDIIYSHENIFKGKLRCNECGKTLSLSIRHDRGGHRSFACSTYRCGTSKCTSHYIAYDDLEGLITGKINEMIRSTKTGRSKFMDKMRTTKAIDQQKKELT